MSTLQELLANTDDDYLVGLSNKGIVKRAYKDLEGLTPCVTWAEESASVNLGEDSCQIRMPLGESSCSCSSRSICRHIVSAILWLKNQSGEKEPLKTEAEVLPKKELLEVPLRKLRGACGAKRYRLFCQKVKEGDKPEITETSTVTVFFQKEEIRVKLIEPLSYSTCSCHSKELCAHKAEAVLWYQLEKNQLNLQKLNKELEEEKTWDREKLQEIAATIKEVLNEQFLTGLSRMSNTAEDTMERMAIICHEGNLPEFENHFRQLTGEYHLYFTRAASFETAILRRKLLTLYNMADKLQKAETIEQISKLAGTFRDTYEPVEQLELMGVGQRYFKSKSGYEGETYYFLELATGNFYTWTDARPTFYEGRRRPPQSGGQMEAPWGLLCSREQMAQLTFKLNHAKATKDGRLSVSTETKGELTGVQDVSHPVFQEKIADRYEVLLKEQFLLDMSQERNQLVFVEADHVGEAEFDSVNQVFHMELFDKEENKIYITVHYTKEEKGLIWTLEKMQERMKKNNGKKKIFFGRLYLEKGKCHLYPIECFERGD